MKVILVDIPVGLIETSNMSVYLNKALQVHDEQVTHHKLVNELNTTLPGSKTFSLGLLYLASVLREEGHQVVYLMKDDSQFDESLSYHIIDAKAILFSCKTTTYPQALLIANAVKEKNPHIITIFGGPHPTALPDEVAAEEAVDIVSIGEGEETIKELAECIEKNKSYSNVRGIAFISDRTHEFVLTPDRPLCDLAFVPEPAYDLLPGHISDYHIYVETGRGCLHNCSFCANPILWKRKVRRFSPERVYKRLKNLSEQLPTGTLVHIVDPAFGFMEQDEKLCKMLIENPVSLRFSCDMCAGNVNEGIIDLLYKAGFVMFCVGIENCNSQILKINHKPATIETIFQACKIIRKVCNAIIKTYWIIGLPGESIQSARDNCDQIISMLKNGFFDICCEHIFVPYPGCDVYNNPEKYQYKIIHHNWECYDARNFPLAGESETFSMESAYIAFLDLLRARCELYKLQDYYERSLLTNDREKTNFMTYRKRLI